MEQIDLDNHTTSHDEIMTEHLEAIKHRIVVFSGKAGVGKSTVSVNLAYAQKAIDCNAAIFDAAIIEPSVSQMLRISDKAHVTNGRIKPDVHEGVKVVSAVSLIPEGRIANWRGPTYSKSIRQFTKDIEWGDLDYLIVDLPPGTGDDVSTMVEIFKPHMALVVTSPADLTFQDSARAINFAKDRAIPRIGLIENVAGLVCPECHTLIELNSSYGGNDLASQADITFMGRLPMDIGTKNLADEGIPIILSCPEARVSRMFKYFARRIDMMLDASSGL